MFKLKVYNFKNKKEFIKSFDTEYLRDKYIERVRYIGWLCVIEKLT